MSLFKGYQRKPNIVTTIAATRARKAPMTESPAPGPIYASPVEGNKQRIASTQKATKLGRLFFTDHISIFVLWGIAHQNEAKVVLDD